MSSYVAVYGAELGIGHGSIEAVVGDDGSASAVYGDGAVADDLRDVVEAGVRGVGPDGRLAWITRGMSYFTVVGPHQFEGDLDDIAAVAAAHGL